jgi:MFS superfamily sulfate permease-like transporter
MAQHPPLKRYVPLLAWLPRYRRNWLRIDALAGITAWGTTVPTAMGFAHMAGLPAQAGLYAAMVALLAYAVLGTSRVLKVETSPSIAVMSAAVVAPLALGNYAYYVTLSAALALTVGLILVVAGIARMGFLADFLAKPVVTGFLFGLALLVIISQLPSLFGLPSGSGSALNQLWRLMTSLDGTNPWTLAITVATFLALLLFRRYAPGLPGALVVIALGILAVWGFNLQELGVAVVGPIPSGIPSPKIPLVRPSDVLFLFLGAMAMVFVALGESLGTARTFAAEHRRHIDTDQELLALGVANLGAGLMRGFAVGANPAATASANTARTKTQLASIVTAVGILLTYATQVEILSYLP